MFCTEGRGSTGNRNTHKSPHDDYEREESICVSTENFKELLVFLVKHSDRWDESSEFCECDFRGIVERRNSPEKLLTVSYETFGIIVWDSDKFSTRPRIPCDSLVAPAIASLVFELGLFLISLIGKVLNHVERMWDFSRVVTLAILNLL